MAGIDLIGTRDLKTPKNPNWQEADQLAIYKCGQGVEPGSAGGQGKTCTWDLRISSSAP